MQSLNTTTKDGWFASIRLVGLLLLASAMLFAVGCDSNDGGMEEPDPEPPGNGFSVEAYDTTSVDDGADEITVSDVSEGGIGYVDADDNEVNEVTWTNDYVYKLDNFVFVNDGQTLNIEPGTVIKGLPGSGADAAALIVSRGGQIYAEGEADAPIIFTADSDPVTPETAPGGGLGRDVRGEWGGVILLGDATINSTPPTTPIEGIPDDIGGDRILYGAENGDFNDDHNVGVFRYVSIRHTGTQLQGGDEIQGLTMGGVGNGSTIEYVESYASDDDGYEWFGGTVNTKNLIAAWVSDDAFDIDEGYRGSNQFWLAVHATDEAGRIGEHDGGTDPEDAQPYATSKVANATYIGVGPGVEGTEGDANDPFLYQRDNNATSYYNTVFMDARVSGAGLQIEDLAEGEDSRERWLAGDLRHENNLWWNVGADYDPETTTFEDIIQIPRDEETGEPTGDGGEAYIDELANSLRNEGSQLASESPIQSIDRESNGVINQFDPRAAGPADATPPAPSEFGDLGGENASLEEVDHYGAFGDENWADGWTLLSQEGEIQ